MRATVEACWDGSARPEQPYRVTFPDPVVGGHYLGVTVRSERWDRRAASEALDLIEHYGYDRRNVRFDIGRA